MLTLPVKWLVVREQSACIFSLYCCLIWLGCWKNLSSYGLVYFFISNSQFILVAVSVVLCPSWYRGAVVDYSFQNLFVIQVWSLVLIPARLKLGSCYLQAVFLCGLYYFEIYFSIIKNSCLYLFGEISERGRTYFLLKSKCFIS